MNTILVPTDFSENSHNALNYAIEMAKAEGAKIILLHVFHTHPARTYLDTMLTEDRIKEEEKMWHDKLKGLQAKIDHAGKIRSELATRLDLAVDGIVKEAAERKVDLIIMGTHGATGLKEVFLGSNTASVIERAHCPVIAVPDSASYKPIKKITYACNYGFSEQDVVEKLVDIARPLGAQVNILHIYENEEPRAREEMLGFMAEIDKKVVYPNLSFELISGKNVEQSLEEYMKTGATDLLVLATHKRDFFDKIFGKSLTKKVAMHSKIPVLAFHNLKKEPAMII